MANWPWLHHKLHLRLRWHRLQLLLLQWQHLLRFLHNCLHKALSVLNRLHKHLLCHSCHNLALAYKLQDLRKCLLLRQHQHLHQAGLVLQMMLALTLTNCWMWQHSFLNHAKLFKPNLKLLLPKSAKLTKHKRLWKQHKAAIPRP